MSAVRTPERVMRPRRVAVVVAVLATVGLAFTQDAPPAFSTPVILPGLLGLPDTNKRTATPDEVRIYRRGEDGKVNRANQPPYPKFPAADVKLADGEEAQFHNALDLSSRRDTTGAAEPLPFKAGVYGTVVFAATGKVLVVTPPGTVLHYLHASGVRVRFGDEVTPDTVLGKTGNWWPGAKPHQKGPIHLHLQATDRNRNLIDVDAAFVAARRPPQTATPFKLVPADWVDFEPNTVGARKPVVGPDGVLKVADSKQAYYAPDRKRIGFDDDAPKVKSK